MLSDELVATFDVNKVHQRDVAAPAQLTFDAVRELDASELRFTKALMAVRSLPKLLERGLPWCQRPCCRGWNERISERSGSDRGRRS